jgi:hypothetical protein
MFIVRCIPTPKDPTERNPKIYYYEDFWNDGTTVYNTSKQQAKKFSNRLDAENELGTLMSAGKIISYKIIWED